MEINRETIQSDVTVVDEICVLKNKNQQIFKKRTKCIQCKYMGKSRKENPQKPTQLSSRSHPRHLVGKRTAQKTPS